MLTRLSSDYKRSSRRGLSSAAGMEQRRSDMEDALTESEKSERKQMAGIGAGMGYKYSPEIASAIGIGGEAAVPVGAGITTAAAPVAGTMAGTSAGVGGAAATTAATGVTAGTGAATGAAAGSVVPIAGTAIGALAGLALSRLF